MAKRLTVSYRRDPGTSAPAPAWRRRRSPQVLPLIRLSGKWLDRLGFPIGSKLRVEAEPGRLVLTAVPFADLADLATDLCSQVAEPGPAEEG